MSNYFWLGPALTFIYIPESVLSTWLTCLRLLQSDSFSRFVFSAWPGLGRRLPIVQPAKERVAYSARAGGKP